MLDRYEQFALPDHAVERLSYPGNSEKFGNVDDKWKLLALVYQREAQGRPIVLRNLHSLMDMAQHSAFRLVRGLELAKLLAVGACLHDAFAAEIELTEDGRKLVARVLTGA